ncbi:MAG: chromosome segregation protein SMC [Gemmatimonadaceae bacterium]|nr:chromosome segregation protein SMC [Gemmatimonadaceae bacterium]
MLLTKLEIHGFKSFADHSSLVFEPGVTAIVGPNGCGKSNVSDAVRWVLGEQRARLLRGAKMEEVIFQGSSARRPVNIAEVSLHFDNSDGMLPVPYQEVVITRRLSRSGESDYLLNRTPCRLRDIQDLVSGTGLGADSGVVIEARMIDALLSDRAEERRELFEEAAGVSFYRDRRRGTDRRLEETTIDLGRLDDLISEVQTQVRSLARQRRRSERHAELAARRFMLELTLAARDISEWREELSTLESRVEELRADAPVQAALLQTAEQQREKAHVARGDAERRRADVAILTSEHQQALLKLDSEIAVAEERQRSANVRRERATRERAASDALGVKLASEHAQVRDDLSQAQADMAEARKRLDERTAGEDSARNVVVLSRAEWQAAERSSRELADRVRHLQLDGERAAREAEELSERAVGVEAQSVSLSEAFARAGIDSDSALQGVEDAVSTAAAAADALSRSRDSATAARSRETVARAGLSRAEEVCTSLQGKVGALEGLERERVGLAPAAARLLKESKRFGDGAILGPLSDFLSPTASSAILLERYLGATVHAVLVRDRAVADAVRIWHTENSPGSLLLLPLDSQPDIASSGSALPALADATDPARGWARVLLGGVVAEDSGMAFVDSRGAVWLPGTTGGEGPLRRRAELAASRTELDAREMERAYASAGLERARVTLAEAEHQAAAAADTAASAQQSLRNAHEHSADAERRRKGAERELLDVQTAASRITSRRKELEDLSNGIARQLLEAGASVSQRELAVVDAHARLTDLEAKLEEAREARTRSQVYFAQIEVRVQAATDRERRLAVEEISAAKRLESLQTELSDIEHADNDLARQLAEWRIRSAAMRERVREHEGRSKEAEGAVREMDVRLTDAERLLESARRSVVELTESLHRGELRLKDLEGKREAIRGRLEAEWRRPLEDLLLGLTQLEDDAELLRSELAGIRVQLEELGQVNPLAVEEHDEEAKRLTFLSTQRDDLASAKASLQQAIREIDATARALFLASFSQVRENFRHIFMTLFGGGECDLKLEHPDNPLDSDIEIHASPRGKRTQRIHLLSSGERALVALSLLFGIFLTKPSPFCLLDEVDAPLDDQNIGRFVRMLTQFKDKTQFIVITHNPRTTTEASDAVYGVTMQEPGVSSVVSVRMRGRQVPDNPDVAATEAVAEAAVATA